MPEGHPATAIHTKNPSRQLLAAITFKARIDPAGTCFNAPADSTLLQAVERSGLEVASSCRNGTCRACIAQLLSGEVMYRIEWPGLSANEKKSGCLLPCAAYPLSDVVWTRFIDQ